MKHQHVDRECRLTISLAASRGSTLSNLALVLEVEVPSSLLTTGVLQVEGEDGLSLGEGILAVGFVGLERLVDDVEGSGRGVGIYFG